MQVQHDIRAIDLNDWNIRLLCSHHLCITDPVAAPSTRLLTGSFTPAQLVKQPRAREEYIQSRGKVDMPSRNASQMQAGCWLQLATNKTKIPEHSCRRRDQEGLCEVLHLTCDIVIDNAILVLYDLTECRNSDVASNGSLWN